MKKIVYNVKVSKLVFLWSVLLVVASSFFIACTQEDLTSPNPGYPEDNQEAAVILKVNTPQATLPAAFSRSRSNTENIISAVKVLVFESNEEKYIYSYYVTGTELVNSDQQSNFKALLQETNKPVKLLILANADDVFIRNAPTAGMSEDDVKKQITEEFSENGWNSPIPMYGEILLNEGVNSSETYTLPVVLLRTVARVDVVKNLIEGNPEFIMESVYAFRTNDKIQVIPDALISASSPKVSSPSVPEGSQSLSNPVVVNISGGSEEITGLYIPESLAATSNEEKQKKATTIVIGGRFNGEDKTTYYRADFNSGMEGHPFGQALRNHRYIFSIKRVTASGWPTPEEAADNLATSITVEIQTWEDFSSELYFDDHRFGISSREISLRYVRNRERRLDVESTLTYQIQWLDGTGTLTGDATSALNTVISNENFDAMIVQDAGDANNITHLVFRTRNDNHAGDIIENKLRITVGKWIADVTVKQDNSAMYSNRFFNVLTAEEVGDLGTTGTTYGSGQAMRRMIDKQFASDGVIKIGGFSFTRVSNSTDYVGATSTLRLSIMKRYIGAQDVIYFPYNIAISSEVADLLLEWLAASAHHVLIIGTDSYSTNQKLLQKPAILADGTWQYFSSNTGVATNFKRATSSSGSEDFFSGPFGTVPESASFNRTDNIAGFSTDYPRDRITPLIVSDKEGYGEYMFFGVNKTGRIIYDGDAQLFQSGQMSNNVGDVANDLDILLGNTWAWVVEQIIYGDK